jgi:hypothetical protein
LLRIGGRVRKELTSGFPELPFTTVVVDIDIEPERQSVKMTVEGRRESLAFCLLPKKTGRPEVNFLPVGQITEPVRMIGW